MFKVVFTKRRFLTHSTAIAFVLVFALAISYVESENTSLAGLTLLSPEVTEAACYGSVTVQGYYRSNGTYVRSHQRSCPDGIKSNNYSSMGYSSLGRGYSRSRTDYSSSTYNSVYGSPYGSSGYGNWNNSGYSSSYGSSGYNSGYGSSRSWR